MVHTSFLAKQVDSSPMNQGRLGACFALSAAEFIAEAQSEGSGTAHRDGLVALPIVRIQLCLSVRQNIEVIDGDAVGGNLAAEVQGAAI
jgi:hypothetical protein